MTDITVLGVEVWSELLSKQPGGLFVGDTERRQPRGNVAAPRAEVRR